MTRDKRTTNRDRFVFWQQAPSPHQAPFIRELAALLPPGRTVCVFQQAPSDERLHMGWDRADYGLAIVHLAPDQEIMSAVLDAEEDQSVHIFSSMQHDRHINDLFWRCVRKPAVLRGILSEARDARGWKGKLRQVDSFRHERRYRAHVNFVLAMGELGVGWYRLCGYSTQRVFQFGYVVEESAMNVAQRQKFFGLECASEPVHIIFVGSLYHNKRVDLLLRALADAGEMAWHLSVCGAGYQQTRLLELVNVLGLEQSVSFRGNIGNSIVRELLESADLLLLPSRFDGWGAVVNEALISGVPVICSDWCGASALIRAGWNGDVFRCGSVRDLTRVLTKWILGGRLTDERRREIRTWAECISGRRMARYVLDVVTYVEGHSRARPLPPWAAPTAAADYSSPLDP